MATVGELLRMTKCIQVLVNYSFQKKWTGFKARLLMDVLEVHYKRPGTSVSGANGRGESEIV